MAIAISARLLSACRATPERAAWLARLPDVVDDLERRWSLRLGPSLDGEQASCSWVAPALRADGTRAVLKLGMPHMEGEHEIAGLRFWNGEGTVRLLDADDALGAMLLERCEPGTPLRALPEPEQDRVIARLLRRLWRVPVAAQPFRSLSRMIEIWSGETLARAEGWPDPDMVREGLGQLTQLARSAPDSVLLATDLHAGNVLQARREPWLAIDPKPFVGDPAYDATQHLLNCEARLRSDPNGTIRRFSDLLGLDHGRVRLWIFARLAAEPRDDWQADSRMELARALAPRG